MFSNLPVRRKLGATTEFFHGPVVIVETRGDRIAVWAASFCDYFDGSWQRKLEFSRYAISMAIGSQWVNTDDYEFKFMIFIIVADFRSGSL